MSKKQTKPNAVKALHALIASMSGEQLHALVKAAFPSVEEQALPQEVSQALGVQKQQTAREQRAHKERTKLLAKALSGDSAAAQALIKTDPARGLKNKGRIPTEKQQAAAEADSKDSAQQQQGPAQGQSNTVDSLAPTRRPHKNTPKWGVWKKVVLETLKKVPFYETAAKAAGITRQSLLEYRDRNPEFAAECAAAERQAVEALGAQCWVRAFAGTTEPIWTRDEKGRPVKVDERRVFDHKLAMFLLQTHGRDKYFLKQVQEVTGPGGSPLQPIVAPTQVQIIIPDNGRDAQAIEVQSETKQISDSSTGSVSK